MLRRRTMMVDTKPTQDWDVVWDYTMGLPEENGFEKVVNGSPSIQMVLNGLNIIPYNGYVRYTPTEFEICNEGIYEETIIYNAFSNKSGNRMLLSNGSYGLQIFIVENQIRFNNGMDNTQLAIAYNIATSKEYIIRIERLNGVNRIYLDGEKIYETEVVSGSYVSGNRIFFQYGGGYLLKSIKFMKIS